jgi:hypothetical protein
LGKLGFSGDSLVESDIVVAGITGAVKSSGSGGVFCFQTLGVTAAGINLFTFFITKTVVLVFFVTRVGAIGGLIVARFDALLLQSEAAVLLH